MLVAYLLTYLASTGYVFTGYFARYAPFTIYVNDMLLAVGVVTTVGKPPGTWLYGAARTKLFALSLRIEPIKLHLPCDSATGLDLDALEDVLQRKNGAPRLAALLCCPNISNPSGATSRRSRSRNVG